MGGWVAVVLLSTLGVSGQAPLGMQLPSSKPAAEGSTPEAGPPSIVIFLVDDLSWADMACYGNTARSTPNTDRLAAEGMRFTAAYSNGPNCAPSRASLLSGQWTPRHGVFTVGSSRRGKPKNRRLVPTENRTELEDGITTFAEALGPRGYRRAALGKWHLGEDPTDQGFDVNIGGDRAGHPHNGYTVPYGNPKLEDGPEGEYLTDRLTEEALGFLDASADGPFLLYLSYYSVHTPIQGRPDLVAASMANRGAEEGTKPLRSDQFNGMVAAVDESIGRVLERLEELELADNTLVVFTSDNGGLHSVSEMGPLRGSKGMLFEGGVRVPWIVRWPGRIEAGSTCSAPVSGVDLYPTLLELANADAPEDHILDGRSLLPLMTDPVEGFDRHAQRDLYWHFPAYLEGRGGRNPLWRTTPAGAIRSGRFKLLEFFEDGGVELYDLVADPGETQDLSASRPEVRDRLLGRLRAWREATGAPVPTEPEPEFQGD